MDQNRRLRIVPYAEYHASKNMHPLLTDLYRSMANLSKEMQKYTNANGEYTRLLADKDAQLSLQMQENEELSTLLAQREDELAEAYDMIDQLTVVCDEANAKYRRLSAYLLKLELELRQLNRTMVQEQPRRLAVPQSTSTVDELLAAASKNHDYVLEQRDNVIYRVKRKG